jgi:serine/threonine-protein kinase
MSETTNKRLGDYEILKVLGSGGMGRVYQVRNTITDRVEAMKVLLPDLEGHEDVAARFQREIKVLAALNHPNIATLHTAFTIDNQLVMIMEYVEGESLSARLNHGPIPATDALKYFDQVLSALSYAHQRHVIHRDIKPANIMLTPEGEVKLMDFGIARSQGEPNKLTATGSTLGSLNYMSPEQIKGEAVDARSDLYSLGISLYEVLTGQRPFNADSNFAIMAAHLTKAPKPPVEVHPGLPAAVNDLILTSIAKAPADRFQSADAFRQAMQRALQTMKYENTLIQGSQDTSAMPAAPTPTYAPAAPAITAQRKAATPVAPATPVPLPPPASHRGLYMALGALVVIAVLIAAGLYMPGRKKASAATEVTEVRPAQTPVVSSEPVVKQEVPSENTETVKPQSAPVRPKKLIAQNQAPPQEMGQPQNLPGVPTQAELDALEHEIDGLAGRAAAVNSSLETLQRQQAAAGYGLRGDIVSKQATMKLNLSKAQDAIGRNDAIRAKKYADMAATDVEALERFLGR